MVADMDQMDGEKREKAVRALAKHIDKALAYHREYDHGLLYVLIGSLIETVLRLSFSNLHLDIISVDVLVQFFSAVLVVILAIT